MIVVALDPGTTTGIAVYNSDTDHWYRTQLGPLAHHWDLYLLLHEWDPDVVVCERFQFQMRQKVVLDSVEYIGVAKLYCTQKNKPLVIQVPAHAKGFWTDDKIKKLNLWSSNYRHAMDATRHLLFYWMNTQDKRFIKQLAGAE